MAAWGAVASAAGSILDSIAGPTSAAVLSQKAWERTKKMMKNRIQWTVQDMQKAGLNPMLLGESGVSVASGSAPSPPTIQTEFGEAASKFSAVYIAQQQAKADLRVKAAQEAALIAQRDASAAQAASNAQDAERKARLNAAGAPEAEVDLTHGQLGVSRTAQALNMENAEAVRQENVLRRNKAQAEESLGPKFRTFERAVTPFIPFLK